MAGAFARVFFVACVVSVEHIRDPLNRGALCRGALDRDAFIGDV